MLVSTEGLLLEFIVKKKWFAFIKSEDFENNVYFNGKNYAGEVRKLIPGQNVVLLYLQKK